MWRAVWTCWATSSPILSTSATTPQVWCHPSIRFCFVFWMMCSLLGIVQNKVKFCHHLLALKRKIFGRMPVNSPSPPLTTNSRRKYLKNVLLLNTSKIYFEECRKGNSSGQLLTSIYIFPTSQWQAFVQRYFCVHLNNHFKFKSTRLWVNDRFSFWWTVPLTAEMMAKVSYNSSQIKKYALYKVSIICFLWQRGVY